MIIKMYFFHYAFFNSDSVNSCKTYGLVSFRVDQTTSRCLFVCG